MLGGALGELMVSEGRVPGLLAWGGRVWLHNKLHNYFNFKTLIKHTFNHLTKSQIMLMNRDSSKQFNK